MDKERQWKLRKIDPETWWGLRLQCLLVRNGNAYAIRLTNIRSTPLVNLEVSVSATIFDDDGRVEYFKDKSIEIPRFDAFTSIDKIRSSFLREASYDVKCKYSDIEGREFYECFNFYVHFDSFREEISSLSWSSVMIYTQFGQRIYSSIFNPDNVISESELNTNSGAIIDLSYILVLGPDSGTYLERLREIQKAISLLGYNSILIRDEKEYGHETVEQKLLRIAMSTRFIIVEDSIAAGQIDELSILARSRAIVAILREHGRGGTWMQSDYDLDFPVQYFGYSVDIPNDLYRSVTRAVDWADSKLRNRRQLLDSRYPWRKIDSPPK